MLITIHLVARLLKAPILRIDGSIVLRDDEMSWRPTGASRARRAAIARPSVTNVRDAPIGRLLAEAEAELEHLARDRQTARRWGLSQRAG